VSVSGSDVETPSAGDRPARNPPSEVGVGRRHGLADQRSDQQNRDDDHENAVEVVPPRRPGLLVPFGKLGRHRVVTAIDESLSGEGQGGDDRIPQQHRHREQPTDRPRPALPKCGEHRQRDKRGTLEGLEDDQAPIEAGDSVPPEPHVTVNDPVVDRALKRAHVSEVGVPGKQDLTREQRPTYRKQNAAQNHDARPTAPPGLGKRVAEHRLEPTRRRRLARAVQLVRHGKIKPPIVLALNLTSCSPGI
jgi:hypothetical protein